MRNLIELIFVVTFFNVLSTNATDYCAVSKEHIMCKYPEIKPGPACGPGTQLYFLSNEEKQLIVEEHNKYRSKIANGELSKKGFPKAARMMKLQWDDELATIAHRWIMQCIDDHDPIRDLPGGKWVGQNLYHFMSTWIYGIGTDVIKSATSAWYSYVNASIPSGFIFKFDIFNTDVGQFIQLAWGDTRRVGCAFQRYEHNFKSKYRFNSKLICNYFTGGNVESCVAERNVLGVPVYETGEPCTKCHKHDKCSNGLCVYTPG